MKAVIQFFEQEKLCYFLAYGGVLGCVRHKGKMIPWDDDVDLIMPREDYEKAIVALKANSAFATIEYSYDADFRVIPMKVAYKQLLHMKHDGCKEMYIDIFALDAVYSNRVMIFLSRMLSKILGNVILFRAGLLTGWKKITSMFIAFFLPREQLMLKRLLINLRHNKLHFADWKPSTLVGEINGAYGNRCIMAWGIYAFDGQVGRMEEFEGVQVRLPLNAEKYLENVYGDWKQIPPPEQRYPRHIHDDPWFYSELKTK